MKKRAIILTAGILLVTGCSQVAPELDGKVGKQNVSDATQIVGDTISIDENKYGKENAKSGADMQNGVDTSRFNSSSDGFKSVYFGFDEYTISSQMQRRINQDVKRAKAAPSGKIKIEGNCDEFGTDEYNYALGLKRAKAVKDAMAAQGVNPNRMVIISYGESNPVCNEPTDACYARNRRTDLRIAN